ncbi:MAG: serine/threonine-protein kinase, partial [Myxococcota bacterium]
SSDPTTAERFRREAVTCSKLRHPNVVFVTDFGLHELGIYIIMEYLDGGSLSHILKLESKLSIGRMARITEQICDALDEAHQLGIVHRDLKPDNIMILNEGSQKDFVKVLDFGIAQIKAPDGEDAEKLTRAGLVLGTPAYISPEQINQKASSVGPGADIYALGVIMYQMITGEVPFGGNNQFEVLSQHMFKIPNPISIYRSDLNDTLLEKFIQRMLEKKAKDRPASMAHVRSELLEAVRELRERGVPDAFYGEPDGVGVVHASDSGIMYAIQTPTPMGTTNIVRHLTANSPESRVSSLVMALRGLASVHEDVFYLAIWGVLQREWLDAPLDSNDFKEVNQQIKMLFKLLLGSPNAEGLSETQNKLFRALRDLFRLADQERQNALVVVLQPLTKHPLFPADVLPDWARAHGSGTWKALRSFMLPFGSHSSSGGIRAYEAPDSFDEEASTVTPKASVVTPEAIKLEPEAFQEEDFEEEEEDEEEEE